MSNDTTIFTEEGYAKLLEEIEHRKTIIRNKIADDIDRARQQGDLSENASYKAAIEERDFNENKISELEAVLKTVKIEKIDKSSKAVQMGVFVVLKNTKTNSIDKYKIVSESEANPLEKKVSIKSPIGLAVLGKKKGDKVKVVFPMGENELIIEDINY